MIFVGSCLQIIEFFNASVAILYLVACVNLFNHVSLSYHSLLIELLRISQVVGVPVTLNGDLKNQFVETNVGFDTICKVSVR